MNTSRPKYNCSTEELVDYFGYSPSQSVSNSPSAPGRIKRDSASSECDVTPRTKRFKVESSIDVADSVVGCKVEPHEGETSDDSAFGEGRPRSGRRAVAARRGESDEYELSRNGHVAGDARPLSVNGGAICPILLTDELLGSGLLSLGLNAGDNWGNQALENGVNDDFGRKRKQRNKSAERGSGSLNATENELELSEDFFQCLKTTKKCHKKRVEKIKVCENEQIENEGKVCEEKKKKKRKKSAENLNTSENGLHLTEDFQSLETKKKKHKKRKKETNSCESQQNVIENEGISNRDEKTKNKLAEFSLGNLNAIENDQNIVENVFQGLETIKKSKKVKNCKSQQKFVENDDRGEKKKKSSNKSAEVSSKSLNTTESDQKLIEEFIKNFERTIKLEKETESCKSGKKSNENEVYDNKGKKKKKKKQQEATNGFDCGDESEVNLKLNKKLCKNLEKKKSKNLVIDEIENDELCDENYENEKLKIKQKLIDEEIKLLLKKTKKKNNLKSSERSCFENFETIKKNHKQKQQEKDNDSVKKRKKSKKQEQCVEEAVKKKTEVKQENKETNFSLKNANKSVKEKVENCEKACFESKQKPTAKGDEFQDESTFKEITKKASKEKKRKNKHSIGICTENGSKLEKDKISNKKIKKKELNIEHPDLNLNETNHSISSIYTDDSDRTYFNKVIKRSSLLSNSGSEPLNRLNAEKNNNKQTEQFEVARKDVNQLNEGVNDSRKLNVSEKSSKIEILGDGGKQVEDDNINDEDNNIESDSDFEQMKILLNSNEEIDQRAKKKRQKTPQQTYKFPSKRIEEIHKLKDAPDPAFLSRLEIKIRKGKFTTTEERTLRANFADFCRLNALAPDMREFARSLPALMRKPMRDRFWRAIGAGLPDRPMLAVKRRFKAMASGARAGRYTAAEERLVRAHMAGGARSRALAAALDRPAFLVRKKVRTLETRRDRFACSEENVRLLVGRLVEWSGSACAEELREMRIRRRWWKRLADEFNASRQRVRDAYFTFIYPRVFGDNIDLGDVKRRLIKILMERGENEWGTVDWGDIAKKHFPGMTGMHLNKITHDVILRHVNDRSLHPKLDVCLAHMRKTNAEAKFRRYILPKINLRFEDYTESDLESN